MVRVCHVCAAIDSSMNTCSCSGPRRRGWSDSPTVRFQVPSQVPTTERARAVFVLADHGAASQANPRGLAPAAVRKSVVEIAEKALHHFTSHPCKLPRPRGLSDLQTHDSAAVSAVMPMSGHTCQDAHCGGRARSACSRCGFVPRARPRPACGGCGRCTELEHPRSPPLSRRSTLGWKRVFTSVMTLP